MAIGSIILDASGRRLLTSAGKLALSNGAGDDCCCGGSGPCVQVMGPTSCDTVVAGNPIKLPSTFRATLSGITACGCSVRRSSGGGFIRSYYYLKPDGATPPATITLPLSAYDSRFVVYRYRASLTGSYTFRVYEFVDDETYHSPLPFNSDYCPPRDGDYVETLTTLDAELTIGPQLCATGSTTPGPHCVAFSLFHKDTAELTPVYDFAVPVYRARYWFEAVASIPGLTSSFTINNRSGSTCTRTGGAGSFYRVWNSSACVPEWIPGAAIAIGYGGSATFEACPS